MGLANIIGNTISSGFVAVGATISDFLFYDPDPEFVNNASITNRGTSGINAVGYSGKSYDFDGVSDFVTLTVSATLTYIELWVRPDTTTMAICDFGAGKEIALTTGTVGTTGLGTVSVTVDRVSSTTMVALKWQLLRVTLDSPTAITTLRLGRNDTTYGSGQISDVQINDSTSYLETNQASSTGIFNSVQGVLATNSGCALIESLSGFNYDPAVSEALKNDAGVYDVFNGTDFYVTGSDANLPSGSTVRTIEIDFLYTPSPGAFRSVFDYGATGTGTRCHVYYNNSSIYFDVGNSAVLCNLSALNANEINTIECVTGATRDDCTIRINGVLQSVTTSNPNTNVNTTLGQYNIGSSITAANFFDGLIKCVRVWSDATKTTKVFDTTNVSGWVDSVNAANGTRNGVRITQQFPEVGIPQSFSKNWNRYTYFDGSDDNVVLSAAITQLSDSTNAWRIEIPNIYVGNSATMFVFGLGDTGDRVAIYTIVGQNRLYSDIRGGGKTIGAYGNIAFNTLYNSIIVGYDGSRNSSGITFNIDGDTSSTSYTNNAPNISLNFGVLTATIGCNDSATSDLFWQGLIPKVDIYDAVSGGNLIHSFSDLNDYNDSVDSITATISGSPTKILIPENPSSLGNDIFANAIIDPQPKFKMDGSSYGNTGQTVAIDYNTPFTITANGVYIYDSASNNAIFSNRDNTANQRGVLAYLDTSNRPVLLMQLNTTTRVQVQSNVAISNDDNVQWISDGTGDASGVTIKINSAAVATTTLQDQDISAGITSAANAYFGIDLDGTANELKGSTGIITLDL